MWVTVKKIITLGAGPAVVMVTAAAGALASAGTAAGLPDVVGEPYADAASAIEEDGGTVRVASRVGDKLDQDDCVVTNAWDASFLRIDAADDSEVMVVLNCAGSFATATNSGTSVAHPLGREAKSAAEEQAATEEERELANPVTPDE